jgi:hypothetical protein
MCPCQTPKTREPSSIEQRKFISIDLGDTHAGAGATTAENSVEGTHQEKKFSENNKTSRAKSKSRR